ncbi:MAG: 2-dehydro-3-deoxy-D-gluconate 5-dehydrogenase KduD [Synergistales bacterium]|nr:2-dehydro-3-deoxy-D-gluconate 5-dehydrogenase KduD [Synergistales bacterium]MDY6401484.1 2-dehydro-3-deoxy-D-gluconate 5-dehydrogenase KduD [Synergistales bacterium]MDY6404118.1 2-dehydro-3-deoxy-D-gluconate 5-dehydrogenase KduD [Synergistales bacterium]MDY6409738.1 2-dehydro-3-deoxy-D-gluconate 5-dehydrogenase KduD [Synergistales bacterium]MDY6414155.1 2-dehydro-3-deoxy-D-gluconate 5-dehydrogenase KduD [Synergistales bacterium]
MTDIFNLSGKVAIVTGARTGIGQGIAEGLAEAGCDVVGAGHAAMPETEAYIKNLGRKFSFYDIDLVNQDKIQALVDETIKTFGRLDILVNNAGIIRREDVLDFSEKNWDDVINMNLKSLFFLSQAVARYMKDNGGGKIINIASMLSFQGGIRVVSYTASKSGVAGITKLMANELAKYNIQVNAIAPGYIATNNTEALIKDPKRSAEILGRIPADRWGKPEDLKGAAVFLASKASDYVSGHILAVDGGWLAR